MAKKKTSTKTFREANRERQQRYRKKIPTGERRRVQLVLDQEVGSKIKYLTQTLGCTQVELFSRLIDEEWERQGKPIPDFEFENELPLQCNEGHFPLPQILPQC